LEVEAAVGVLMSAVLVAAAYDVVCDIRISKKRHNGIRRLAHAATSKFPWYSLRSSQKINDGKY
jgi:hypothetical protein